MIEMQCKTGRLMVVITSSVVLVVFTTGLLAAKSLSPAPASPAGDRLRALGLPSAVDLDTKLPPATATTAVSGSVPTTTAPHTSKPPKSTPMVAVPPAPGSTTTDVPAPQVLPPPGASTPNGTGSWSGVTNGITTTLRMEPVTPRAGDTVHFFITASYPTQFCCTTTFYTGDGTMVGPTLDPHACPEVHPSTFTEQVDHVFTHAGSYTAEVQPSAGDFCSAPPTFINAQLYVDLLIEPR